MADIQKILVKMRLSPLNVRFVIIILESQDKKAQATGYIR